MLTALQACKWAANPGDHALAPIGRYYSINAYAGNLFTSIEPRDPFDLTASDLLATTMLSVDIPTTAARALLTAGEERDLVLAALRGVPDAITITEATDQDWLNAEAFYLATKSALGLNPWVTASKLAARKRPSFLPVRDNVIRDLLRPGRRVDYQQDWYVARHLMLHSQVRDGITHLRETAEAVAPRRVDPQDLRLLDVALWMFGMNKRQRVDALSE